MQHNYRFHAFAIGGICVAVTALYLIIGPKEQAEVPQGPLGDRYIQIESATWGEACNPYIQQMIREQKLTPPQRGADGIVIQEEPPALVRQNNVLTIVSDVCNGRMECEITPSSRALGVEPLASCYKKLEIRYRCYAYDRLWNLTIEQGKTDTINCEDNATSPISGQAGSPNTK